MSANLSLTVHPQVEDCRRRNRQLQIELARLIAERDELKHTTVPNIQAEYQIKIGALEWRVFQMDCETRALIRRIEMAQAALNRGGKPCFRDIEQEIKTEFSAWREKIEQQAREIKEARKRENCLTLSQIASRELHTLYRKLAFLLHPDITGAADERKQKLWLQVAEAYQEGDLTTLRTIRLIIGDETAEENLETAPDLSILEILKNRQSELKQACEKLLGEIAAIKTTAPFVWHKILDDEMEVEKRQNELRGQIAVLREKRFQLTSHWAEIMRFAEDREDVSIPEEPPDIFADDNWAEIICE